MNAPSAFRCTVLVVMGFAAGGCTGPAEPWPPPAGSGPPLGTGAPGGARDPYGWREPPRAPESPPEHPGAAVQIYTVRLREGASATDFARRHRLTVQSAMRSDPATANYRGSAAPGVLERLQRDPAVIWAEPDRPARNVPMSP